MEVHTHHEISTSMYGVNLKLRSVITLDKRRQIDDVITLVT